MTAAKSQHEHDLATLADDGHTGWWEEHGRPAPWPEDFFDPDSDWRPDTQPVTLNPAEQPF